MLRPSSGMGGGGGASFSSSSITGAPAASTLALADVFPVSQSGTLGKATIQQALDAYGLVATDSAPADADLVAVNQGGVAKTLAISALRLQLDTFGAPRTIQATEIDPGSGSLVMIGGSLTFTGNLLQSNSGSQIWARAGTDFRLANGMPIVFCSGDAQTGGDCGVARDSAGVVRFTDGGSGYGQIRFGSSTGVGIAAFGTNCPASILTAPYAWLKANAQDGTPCVVPAYKL